MEWIPISEIKNSKNVESKSLLFWQENLSDTESSRFQRGIFYGGEISFVRIYPLDGTLVFKESNSYIGYDLEGDKCQLTHFAKVSPPIKQL